MNDRQAIELLTLIRYVLNTAIESSNVMSYNVIGSLCDIRSEIDYAMDDMTYYADNPL